MADQATFSGSKAPSGPSTTKRKTLPAQTEAKMPHKHHIVPDVIRNELIAAIGEFCGTFMFLLLSFIGTQTAIQTNDPGNPEAPLRAFSLMYIAASFGTAVAVNVWIFYRVSGGMFNPAVTIGLMLVGAVKPLRVLFIIPTQIVASIAAAALTNALLPGPLLVRNALAPGVSTPRGLFLETFLTAQLILTVYFLAVEKHRATFLAPIGIGIALFACHICGTNFTGTGVNPARSFGPAVVAGFEGGNHWIYWLGPFMGSGLSFGVYKLFKWLEYKTANPGQDGDGSDVEKAEEDEAKSVVRSPTATIAGGEEGEKVVVSSLVQAKDGRVRRDSMMQV